MEEGMVSRYIAMVAATIVFATTAEQQPSMLGKYQQKLTKEESSLTPEQWQKVNYGKYDIPPTMKVLLEMDKELKKQNLSIYDGLHFYPVTGGARYFNTPSDVIPFGYIGADGIHYGFLTDFGSVTDLENAPIVCVSPMDFDQPARIIANNIREFLRVNMTDEELFYNHFTSEQEYQAQKQKWALEYEPDSENQKKAQTVYKLLLEKVTLPNVENPFQYVQQVRTAREKQIVLETQDKLGIVNRHPADKGKTHVLFPVHKDEPLNLEKLKAYLRTATYSSKLALFRDVQMNFVLSDEKELRDLIVAEMRKMGLHDEADRILHSS
jgi:hypothetical protein